MKMPKFMKVYAMVKARDMEVPVTAFRESLHFPLLLCRVRSRAGSKSKTATSQRTMPSIRNKMKNVFGDCLAGGYEMNAENSLGLFRAHRLSTTSNRHQSAPVVCGRPLFHRRSRLIP